MTNRATTYITAVKAREIDRRTYHALRRLLDDMKDFVRVYPVSEAEEMPEHDVAWVDGPGDRGPGVALRDAIKSYPELWAHALPEDVCLVPRYALRRLGVSEDVAEFLSEEAAAIVATHATIYLHDREDWKGRKRK